MNLSDEGQVLHWFERAIEQPTGQRREWLATHDLPQWLLQRVQRLLDVEASLDREYLEQSAAVPIEALLKAHSDPMVMTFPKVGEQVGHYELLREIDAGGMGVVFLARRADQSFEQQVAIKLIRPLHLHASPAFRQRLIARFENERALLAKLDHPNIARIIDGGATHSGIPYLVMEYVAGDSLLEYCSTHALTVRRRLQVFQKVCQGVQEAHRHLIVHRDLKPENILVTAAGQPRLLDFGIARTLEAQPEESTATLFTAMTPAYASPEQVRRETLTTSSDVYSLGVVLYQLLTGTRPYDLQRLSPAEAERVVSEATPPSLREALQATEPDPRHNRRQRAQLTSDLDRIVSKAMHKDATRRYGSAQELSDELQRFLDGRPVLAHPDSTLYRLRRFIARHRTGSSAAMIAVILLIAEAGVVISQTRKAARAADDAQQINAFLLDMLQMSDPFDSGSELTLSQAVDAAANLIDERFAQRADLSAEIRFGLGYSMLSRYQLAPAEQQLQRALAESTEVFGADDIRTLRVVEGIAGLRQEQGRPQEAEAMFKQGIAGVENNGLTTDPLYVDLLGNLGNLYLVQEDYAAAQRWLQQALAAQTAIAGEATLDQANLLSNLAHAAHGLVDLERADQLYQQAQRAHQALFPNGNPDLASVLNNRALLAEERGQQRAALQLHEQSLALRQRLFSSEHPMIVVALANVARLSLELAEPARGLEMAQRAATMADRVYTEPNAWHASVYTTLANANLASGNLSAAQQAWQTAEQLLATIDAPPSSVTRYLERARTALCERSSSADFCAN